MAASQTPIVSQRASALSTRLGHSVAPLIGQYYVVRGDKLIGFGHLRLVVERETGRERTICEPRLSARGLRYRRGRVVR